MKNESLKYQHEIAVCKRFLNIYNNRGVSINFVRQGDPQKQEPDCICSERLAIEVVGIADNQYQHERIYSEARNKIVRRKPDIVLNSWARLNLEIQKKIEKLNAGNYSGFNGKIILLCDLLSPLIETKEVIAYRKKYESIKGSLKSFDEIWTIWHVENSTESAILQLE